MIFNILTNINYLIYIFCILIILLIITYLIYKIFILENDVYIINEKLNKIELEFNNPNIKTSSLNTQKKNNLFNFTDIIMNEVFNNNDTDNNTDNNICNLKSCNNNKCSINITTENKDESNIIDIDKILNNEVINNNEEKDKEQIFDLKKEIVSNDNESVISNDTQITKKKLQKLNLDKLKEKCNELNISSEGTKAQLIEKILEEINKEV